MSEDWPPPTISAPGSIVKTGPYVEIPVCADCCRPKNCPQPGRIPTGMYGPIRPPSLGGVCPMCGGEFEWVVGRWRRVILETKRMFSRKAREEVLQMEFMPGREQDK